MSDHEGRRGLLSRVAMLDPLWCLWDDNSQCLHDKAVETLVINDERDTSEKAGSKDPFP